MASAEHVIDTSQKDLVNIYDDLNEFCEDNDFDKTTEASELYDAVLTGSVNRDESVPSKVETPKASTEEGKLSILNRGGQSLEKHSLYIGSFSWWTSDKDLIYMAQSLGVMDIMEIKFAENKINGQSRGYAEIVVSSAASVRTLLDKVPQCKINGENLSCRSATCQNLAMFETLANKRMPMRVNSKDPVELNSQKTISSKPCPLPTPHMFPLIPPPNFPPLKCNPFLTQPPPPSLHIPLNIPPPMLPPFPPPPFHFGQPLPSLHINPAFLPPCFDHNNSSSAYNQNNNSPKALNEDFEELMNRNRTISSTAITKAVSDATTGDMHMATETLLTAIAVIKKSRVYEDDRCQALVTSLKDCLVSIQGKNERRDRDRDRVKERDRNREREREGSYASSRRYRERSCSGGRDRTHDLDTRDRNTRDRDMRDQDMRNRNMRDQDMRDRNMRDRDMREQDMRDRNMRDQDMRDRIMRDRDMRDQDMRDRNMRDRDMREQDMRDRNMRDQDMRDRNMRDRDMRERDRHRDPRDRYR